MNKKQTYSLLFLLITFLFSILLATIPAATLLSDITLYPLIMHDTDINPGLHSNPAINDVSSSDESLSLK